MPDPDRARSRRARGRASRGRARGRPGEGRTRHWSRRRGVRGRAGQAGPRGPAYRRDRDLGDDREASAGPRHLDDRADEDVVLDLTVDGADEVAPNLDLVKGWGGALARERIVAASSRRQVILVGPEKLVDRLGQRGRIPVEVIPLARGLVARELRALGLTPTVRPGADGVPFHTDNGNLTLDCAPGAPLADGAAARALEAAILAVPGVVDTGLFLGTAERVLVGHPDGRVEVRTRGGHVS